MICKAQSRCVTLNCFLIGYAKVSKDTMEKSRFSGIELGEPVPLNQLGRSKSNPGDDYETYLETCIAGLLKVLVTFNPGVAPSIDYTGIYRPQGYGFRADLVRNHVRVLLE